jgi:hypothetical protein
MLRPATSSSRLAKTQKRAAFRLEPMEQRQLLSVSTSFVPVTISPSAIAADSQLSNYKSFDLKVTISSGDDWASGDLKINLSSGNFYVPSSNQDFPQKGSFASKPNLEFDTYVSSPNFNTPIILGKSYLTGTAGDAIFTSTSIDVAWGDLVINGAGTFTIARLTVKNGSAGTLNGRVGSFSTSQNPPTFSYGIGGGGTTGGSISGTVFNDANGNRAKDSGEAGVSGRTVYIDLDNDSFLDSNETRVTTNGSGVYALSNLPAGTYKVREVIPSGWSQTTPTNNFGLNVTLSSGQNSSNQNFGVKQNTTSNTGAISGNVFHDFNRNGAKDTGDTGLASWTVYLDKDNDSILDSNEVRVLTDSNGNYIFNNLAAGTYKIRIVRAAGYVQTTPTNNFGNNATLTSGQKVTGKNFGADN